MLDVSVKGIRDTREIGQVECLDAELIRELLLQFIRVGEIADRAHYPAPRLMPVINHTEDVIRMIVSAKVLSS